MIISNNTSTTGVVLTGDYIISKVVLNGGSANSFVVLDDSTDGTGTAKVTIKALANDTTVLPLGEGLRFTAGVYATLSGTGAEVYVYYK